MEQVLELMHMYGAKNLWVKEEFQLIFSYTYSWANVWGHKFGYTALPSVIGNETLM